MLRTTSDAFCTGQGMSSSRVQKQRNYAQLAARLNDFKNTTSEYERLLEKLANQHKALSDMGAWHAAQYERDSYFDQPPDTKISQVHDTLETCAY
jgi:hypothetical protein